MRVTSRPAPRALGTGWVRVTYQRLPASLATRHLSVSDSANFLCIDATGVDGWLKACGRGGGGGGGGGEGGGGGSI